MPDLSLAASHRYWKDYQDPIIYRVIAFLESVETWTLDGDPELEASIEQLGEELDNLEGIDFSDFGHQDKFIRIACNIRSSRTLRLLQAIDTQPGSASRLLVHAEETSEGAEDPPGVFLRRNIVFERLRLLSRVFSKQRLNLVMRALEGEEL